MGPNGSIPTAAPARAVGRGIPIVVVGSDPRLPDEVGDLSLQSTQVGQRTVIAATGEIDLVTAHRVEEAAAAALDAGAHELWIDLSEVEFLDSTGIHALLTVRTSSLDLNRSFAVICPPGPIRRAFHLTGLDDALPLFASREEAHRNG
jgi:anti-anti-sigma factor